MALQCSLPAKKKWDNLEIAVYPGADGDFTLYEDENDNYNYEKGKYSEIKFHWDDKKRKLSILDRTGTFDGMLNDRNFKIVLAPDNQSQFDHSKVAKSVTYSGKALNISL